VGTENKERWMELAAQAATEHDPQRLMALIKEINLLLEEKERQRLDIQYPGGDERDGTSG
jgi:hypothetical protein